MPLDIPTAISILTDSDINCINFIAPDYQRLRTGSGILNVRRGSRGRSATYPPTSRGQISDVPDKLYLVYPDGFRTIAQMIEQHSIELVHYSSSEHQEGEPDMVYYEGSDNISFADSLLSAQLTLNDKALFIHECTHALMDYNGINVIGPYITINGQTTMPRYIFETMGYVSQLLYYIKKEPNYIIRQNENDILKVAYQIAKALPVRRNRTIEYTEMELMKDALARNHNYNNPFPRQSINNLVAMNGIQRDPRSRR